MSTVYPAAKDTFTNPSSSQNLNQPDHAQQHANANDAIEALQTKVGIDGSTDPTSLEKRVTDLELGTLPDSGYFIVGPAGSGAQYTNIQDALDAATGGGLVKILGGTYTITSGLLFKYDSTIIEGSFDSTVLQVDGSVVTTLLKANTAGLSRCGLRNIRLIQTNVSAQGTALDLSNMPIFDLQHVYAFNFNLAMKLDDTNNTTFYSSYRDFAAVQCNNGIDISSTNPVNDNYFENIRLAYNANGFGLRITQGQSNSFNQLNCEPNSSTGTTGIILGNAGTGVVDTLFINTWVEGNNLGASINSAVLRTKFIGCNIGYNTSNISDSSPTTTWLSCREQDSLKNDHIALRSVAVNGGTTDCFTAYINSTAATNIGFKATNDTNFAHSGEMFYGRLYNGSDTGNVFRARNNGSGYSFLGENDAGTDTFGVDKDGNGFFAGTLEVDGNTSLAGTLAVTDVITPTGGVAAAGGFTAGARLIHTGGMPARVSTDGNDTTPSTTETYIGEVFVPANCTINGVAVFNGSAVAGNIKVGLTDSSGSVVASSASTAASGTDAYQRVPFSSSYAAKGPATYYVLLQSNNTSYRFNTHLFGDFGAAKKTGETFGTLTTITPPTTFAANLAPIASLY